MKSFLLWFTEQSLVLLLLLLSVQLDYGSTVDAINIIFLTFKCKSNIYIYICSRLYL